MVRKYRINKAFFGGWKIQELIPGFGRLEYMTVARVYSRSIRTAVRVMKVMEMNHE